MKIKSASINHSNKKQLLQERVFGKLGYVYHGSNAPPNVMIDLIKNREFNPGGGAGAMYGPGLYTVREFNPQLNTFNGQYGRFVYKFKANLAGVISFDSDITQTIYGKEASIFEQIKIIIEQSLVGSSSIEKLKKFLNSNKSADLNNKRYDYKFSSEAAVQKWNSLIEYTKGIAFTGQQDGPVVVFYSLDGVVPIGWAQTGGKSEEDFKWNKIDSKNKIQNQDYEHFNSIIKNNKNSKKINSFLERINEPKIQLLFKKILKSPKSFEIKKKLLSVENLPVEIFNILSEDENLSTKISIALKPNCPINILDKFSKNENKILRGIVAKNPNCSYNTLENLSNDEEEEVRDFVVSRKDCPPKILNNLSNDEDRYIRIKVSEHPNCSYDTLENLSNDEEWRIRREVAKHPSCSLETLKKLSSDSNIDVRQQALESLNDRNKTESLKKKIKQILKEIL
jgi:hypothetical protein